VNAADLAVLQLAKRAYAAAQPSESEVQTGVRRARLALRRGKSRRSWFGKGLVLVVLAFGGLAYAKPHVLGELVEGLTQASGADAAKRGTKRGAPTAPAQPLRGRAVAHRPAAPELTGRVGAAEAEVVSNAALDTAPSAAALAAAKPHGLCRRDGAAKPVRTSQVAAVGAASPTQETPEKAVVSDWGRVAQALGRGDEAEALTALSALSESDDQRTRDKADLGRAQLFVAGGDHEKACALAHSLNNRRAGSHIERQAQLLLKSCTP